LRPPEAVFSEHNGFISTSAIVPKKKSACVEGTSSLVIVDRSHERLCECGENAESTHFSREAIHEHHESLHHEAMTQQYVQLID
jgi:hypothetical protein